MNMGKWVHRLTDKDEINKTAECAECGSVAIRSVGKGGWQCVLASRKCSIRYGKTPKGKAGKRENYARFVSTPEGKASRLATGVRSAAMPAHKVTKRESTARRLATPEGKAHQQEYSALYATTPKGKTVRREASARYRATPKGKAYFAEYATTVKCKEIHRRSRQKTQGHLCPELNLQEKSTLVGMQRNHCPVCENALDAQAEWGDPTFAQRDHAHEKDSNPGEYRGYLCGPCNSGLDRFDRETPKGARAAAYLELADKHYWHNEMLKVQAELMKEMVA